METAGEDGSGQTRVETIHEWPMFREEYKGLTNYTWTLIRWKRCPGRHWRNNAETLKRNITELLQGRLDATRTETL